jgi:thiosulfate dehydrogenase [quinone] large subunit
MAKEPFIGWADTLNWMALMFVGITLILGFYEKLGALVGVLLLALYYFSHPAFPWLQQLNVEGSYWFINKNLIELAACLVIYQYPTGHVFGLKYLINRKEQPKTETV